MYFDENAENERQRRVSVNETHYRFSRKQYHFLSSNITGRAGGGDWSLWLPKT